jgi:hypothetical protein
MLKNEKFIYKKEIESLEKMWLTEFDG